MQNKNDYEAYRGPGTMLVVGILLLNPIIIAGSVAWSAWIGCQRE